MVPWLWAFAASGLTWQGSRRGCGCAWLVGCCWGYCFRTRGCCREWGRFRSDDDISRWAPLDITAERIDYLQEQEIYEADGSVVVNQGTLRLTADHMTIQALPGVLIATGHVRLIDPKPIS